MADVLFLALIVALFGVSVLFIRACDHIIGTDDEVVIGATSDDDNEEVLAA